MKYILLFLLCFSAHADDWVPADWSSGDTTRQTGYYVLHVIDWAQTRYIAANPIYWEKNTLIGSSLGDINAYFIGTGLFHYAISAYLPPDYRRRWQWFTIGLEAGVVASNLRIGVKLKF
jgi:hypothetical protein